MAKRHSKIGRVRTHRFRRVGSATRELVKITLDQRLLWGMRIPIADNRGRVFSQPHHKAFMNPVLKKSGGSTENSALKAINSDDLCVLDEDGNPVVGGQLEGNKL